MIMSTSFTPPPPLAVIYGGSATSIGVYDTSSQNSSASSSSIIIVVIIIASAIIVSASIFFLLRYLSRRFHRSFSAESDGDVLRHDANSNQQQQRHEAFDDLLDSLPLFTFRSVTPNIAVGDCAVCLSKFQPHDQLRLLPLCCHAFHAACIDAWIVSNQTCPLCRSTVLPSGADVLDKILSAENQGKINNNISREVNGNGGSFLIEIGNISRRHAGSADAEAADTARRLYSVDSFQYIVDDNGYEVSVGFTTHSRRYSDFNSNDKESTVEISIPPASEPPGEVLAAEVSDGRNRLRECVDRLASISSSSRTMSFMSSGRFFSGSSRRSEGIVAPEDLDAYRAGEEISEIFRWLSGV